MHLLVRRGEPLRKPPLALPVHIVPLRTITTTWPLLLGMGVLMLGAGLQGTLLGLRATLEGFPTPVTGVVMSCYYIGYLLGTVAAPRLLRQVGHIRVFAALAGGDAPDLRSVLRRHLCCCRELAQRSCKPG
jgi:hypothetical protein